MTHTRSINPEGYAQKVLELFDGKREDFVKYALNLISEGISSVPAGERLERRVKSKMKDVLFEYLKRNGTIRGEYIHNYTYGYCTRRFREPRKSEVYPNLLDIERLLPYFEEVIGNIMADAERLWIDAEVGKFTRDAKENDNGSSV